VKYVVFGFLVLCAVTLAHSQNKAAVRPLLTTDQICASDVVGSLGLPLGTCARIQATITTRNLMKRDSGDYFLTITHVDGQRLPTPVVSRFFVHSQATRNVKLANDNFALYELRTGKKAGSLDTEQIARLEEGYVGRSVNVLAYQTGSFSGTPNHKKFATWQGTSFHFSTHIVVMDQYR
jgi:hypothetical protein